MFEFLRSLFRKNERENEKHRKTTIQIKKETLKELRQYKITKMDTYNEIIKRFMKNLPKNKIKVV